MSVPVAPLAGEALRRTRIFRAGPGEAPWELWQRARPPELGALVAGTWAGVTPHASARHRTLPNGEVVLMLHLGPTQRLTERNGASCDEPLGGGFVAGLQERPVTFACVAPFTRVAAVQLRPLGAWMLSGGLPQAELAGRVFELESVLGARSGIAGLRARMLDADDLGAVLDLLDAFMLERFRTARRPHPVVRAASGLLAGRGGALRVSALARETGVSTRRLHELFLREIGISPKRLARVMRFRGALERLAAAPVADLAGVAHACGYYDQAHLNRDFRDLAGMTPSEYLAADGRGLDGPHVVSG